MTSNTYQDEFNKKTVKVLNTITHILSKIIDLYYETCYRQI